MSDKNSKAEDLLKAGEAMGDLLHAHAHAPGDVAGLFRLALNRWAELGMRTEDEKNSAVGAIGAAFGDFR